MSTVASLRAAPTGGTHGSSGLPRVAPGGSWALVSDLWPVDPAGGVENASPTPTNRRGTSWAFPTPPWTALRTAHKAPQAKPTITLLREERMILTVRTTEEEHS
jgi:hypothetical protein